MKRGLICNEEILKSFRKTFWLWEWWRDPCEWILKSLQAAHCLAWFSWTSPSLTSRRGRLQSPFPNSGLWIHKGLLAASRRNEYQVYTGWLFCWQKSWGPLVKKELEVRIFFLKVSFSYTSVMYYWYFYYQYFQGQKLFLYKSLAAVSSCNSSGCPNMVTATKGPIKSLIAERNTVNFTTDTLNSEEGLEWSYQCFPPI